MADKTAVTVTLAGDSTSLERSFAKVGSAAQELKSDFAKAEGGAGRFNSTLEHSEAVGDNTERGLRGLGDILGVTAGAFGLNIGPAGEALGAFTQLGGGVADLSQTLGNLPIMQKAADLGARAMAVGQAILNAVMAANPILLVVVAIAALVAIFIVAYTTSQTFRDIVNGAFQAVLGVVQTVWGWIQSNWPLLLAILTGPIGLAVLAITTHFDDIKDLASGAKDWIVARFTDLVSFVTGLPGKFTSAASGAFNGIKSLAVDAYNSVTGKLGDIAGFVRGLPGSIASAASGMFNGITNALRSALNAVVDMWNRFGIPSFHVSIPVPFAPDISFDTPSIDLPDLPHFHQGGLVPGGPNDEMLAVLRGGERVLRDGGGGNIYNISVTTLDARGAAKAVVDAIDEYERRNGRRYARA